MSKQRRKHPTVVLREQQYRYYRRKAMTTRLHHRPRVRALQKVKVLILRNAECFIECMFRKWG